jgi:methyltransferase OMS1
MCKGHVLEVSCGTGRNLGYFDIGLDSKVESLTFVDLSPKMVEVCRRKWDVLYAGSEKNLKPGLQVRFLAGSALAALPPPPSTSTSPSSQTAKLNYDTILQTVGLCSTPSPVSLLVNLARHLDTSNPDARILLLEHGRSYRDWLNKILDNSAEAHAEKWGCWQNRDIGALVAEAASRAGLEVVRERRWHLGTTWVFELKAADVSKQSGKGEEEGAENDKEKGESGGGGWFGWR